MNNLFRPLFVGLVIGVGVYLIIKASKNNPKVIRAFAVLSLSISAILAVILLLFLLKVMFKF